MALTTEAKREAAKAVLAELSKEMGAKVVAFARDRKKKKAAPKVEVEEEAEEVEGEE